MRVGVMWEALRQSVSERGGFYIRLSDDSSQVQEVLLFLPHGTVALLIMAWPGAKMETEQIKRILRFQKNAIPVHYANDPDSVSSEVYCAAANINP